MSEDFVLFTSKNNKLNISAFGFQNLGKAPCIILVHGFKGFKDWGFGGYVGKFFFQRDYFVLSFNFSHNGVGDSLTEFVEPDKFAENTFSLEIEELSELINAYLMDFFGKGGLKRIGLIGHSRGGGISLLTAKNQKLVKAVSVWSSVSDFDRYTKRQKDQWKKKGFIEILNTRTKQKMKIGLSLLQDLEKNKDNKLNIIKTVKNLKKPLLIVHGEQDLSVPVKEAYRIYDSSDKSRTELFTVPKAGHTYDIKHPFEGSNPKFDSVLEKTNTFFMKYLN
jgi:uncharacterized protein